MTCEQHSGIEARLKGVEANADTLFRKLDKIQAWLMVIAGGLILSLVLLVVNLAVNGRG